MGLERPVGAELVPRRALRSQPSGHIPGTAGALSAPAPVPALTSQRRLLPGRGAAAPSLHLASGTFEVATALEQRAARERSELTALLHHSVRSQAITCLSGAVRAVRQEGSVTQKRRVTCVAPGSQGDLLPLQTPP